MPSNRRMTRKNAAMALVFLAMIAPTTLANAGPISDMLARHRQERQMKLPPVSKPFDSRPIKDLTVHTTSLKDRFKQRFSLRRGPFDGLQSPNQDAGVVKTSR